MKCDCPCCTKRREARRRKKLSPEELQREAERNARFEAALKKNLEASKEIFEAAERSERNIDRSIIVR